MSISDATETAILALVFNATAWANYADNAASTPQTTTALALHTADPLDAGSQTTSEAPYTGYTRGSAARSSAGWTVSGTSPTQAALTAAVPFGASTGGTTTALTNFSVGKSGGGATAILWTGAISPSVTPSNGVTPSLTTATVCTLD